MIGATPTIDGTVKDGSNMIEQDGTNHAEVNAMPSLNPATAVFMNAVILDCISQFASRSCRGDVYNIIMTCQHAADVASRHLYDTIPAYVADGQLSDQRRRWVKRINVHPGDVTLHPTWTPKTCMPLSVSWYKLRFPKLQCLYWAPRKYGDDTPLKWARFVFPPPTVDRPIKMTYRYMAPTIRTDATSHAITTALAVDPVVWNGYEKRLRILDLNVDFSVGISADFRSYFGLQHPPAGTMIGQLKISRLGIPPAPHVSICDLTTLFSLYTRGDLTGLTVVTAGSLTVRTPDNKMRDEVDELLAPFPHLGELRLYSGNSEYGLPNLPSIVNRAVSRASNLWRCHLTLKSGLVNKLDDSFMKTAIWRDGSIRELIIDLPYRQDSTVNIDKGIFRLARALAGCLAANGTVEVYFGSEILGQTRVPATAATNRLLGQTIRWMQR